MVVLIFFTSLYIIIFLALTILFLCFLMALLGQMHGLFLLYFSFSLLLCIPTFEGCISVKNTKIKSQV